MGITKGRTPTVALALVILAVAFVLDLLTPLGLAIWLLYLIPLAVASAGVPRSVVLSLTTLCTVLVVLGFFGSPAGMAPQVEVANRALIIGALWAGTLLLLQRRRTEESLRRLQEDTEARVRARTADLDVANRALQAEVAERTRAEDVLHRYRLLAEHARDIVLFVRRDGRILEANEAAVAAYGYPRETLLNLTVQDLRAPETQSLTAHQMTQAVTDGILFETVHRRRDGTPFPVEVSSRATTLGEEVVLLSIVRDITVRKAAEQALATRTRHLEAVRAVSEEITRELDLTALLQLIIERATHLVGAAAATVLLWNEAEQLLIPCAWLGYGEWRRDMRFRLGEGIVGEIAARRVGIVANDYPMRSFAHAGTLARLPITAAMGEPLVYRERLIGVLTVDYLEPGQHFAPPDQEILRLFAAQAAIAIENARLFAELHDSYARLQAAQVELVRSEKLRGLGQMAAGIAHDLNNTLATILGQAELLRLRARQPEVQDGLRTLLTAATDGAAVVRRLQDFARQRGSGPLGACDLSALVPEALELTRPRWREEPRRRGITIDAVTEVADLPLIQGNPGEIREALANLIFNAVDAMPQGGSLRVTGRVHDARDGQGSAWRPGVPTSPGSPPGLPEPRWVELAVADTGVGMTDEVRQRAFDPFFTTKGLHGTGLGLSVVYGIMERHGGRVQATSTPGRGTTIVLQFRLAPPDPERPAPPVPPAVIPSRRILVVDDDPAVRHTLATLLRASGQDVIEAESAAAGLRCLETIPVDLVVTDLGMPDVTGWEVARAAKARRPELPVVLLTGWGDQVEAEAPASVRVDRVLTKPVPRHAILAVIAELTTRR